jgi:hypothetical protein
MDATTLLITMYCLIDDWLAGRRLRQRGSNPIVADSEVLTIECVGEFLGIDTDKGLHEHFRHYYRDWFPALGRIHRTTFASNCSARSAMTRRSRSWTAFRCRSAASAGPTAAGGWPSWPASAATRAPSRPSRAPSTPAGVLAGRDR